MEYQYALELEYDMAMLRGFCLQALIDASYIILVIIIELSN